MLHTARKIDERNINDRNIDERKIDYQMLDSMDTAALREFLRADIEAPAAEQADIELVMYAAQLLAERRQSAQEPPYKDLAVSKAEFFEHYYPLLAEEKSLYDFAEDFSESFAEDAEAAAVEPRIKPAPGKLWRRLGGLAAALVLLVFAGTVTADALGFNPFASAPHWDDDVFWFECIAETPDMADRLPEHVEMPSFIPKWVPDGFVFDNMETYKTMNTLDTHLLYTRETPEGTEIMHIGCLYMIVDIAVHYEKDDTAIEVYTVNGIDHYIMSNLEFETVAWRNGNAECWFGGRITVDEAKRMIDSIYE